MRPHSSASNLASGIVALSEASTLDGPWAHPNLMAQFVRSFFNAPTAVAVQGEALSVDGQVGDSLPEGFAGAVPSIKKSPDWRMSRLLRSGIPV